jgi:hypothetical protein
LYFKLSYRYRKTKPWRTQIQHKRDLSSLSLVSKKFYELTLQYLYESIIINAKDETNLQQTDVQKFLCSPRRHHLSHVKAISFLAPIRAVDQFRCIHYTLRREFSQHSDEHEGAGSTFDAEDEGEDSDVDGDDADIPRLNNLGNLMPTIKPLFDRLEDHQLKSFA